MDFSLSDVPDEIPSGTIQMYYSDQKSAHIIVTRMESVFKTSASYARDRQPEQQDRKELHDFSCPIE